MSQEKSILLLSDDPAEKQAALAVLRAANPDGRLSAVDNPKDAFEQLSAHQFDCVFSCLVEGPEASVNFLTEVWNRAPNVSRFVVAPSVDSETQLRCAFAAHHFLSTPLEAAAVQNVLAEAEAKHAILPNDRVQILISRMRSLPSKPSIYFEVMRELHAANPSATIIAGLVGKDIGIASKLIQVVNSLFYARVQAIHDIEEAILFLGFDVTASIVLSLEALSHFEKVQPIHPLADQVWEHSQPLAELAKRIALSFGLNRSLCDRTYLAGLLHDVGKLVLAQNFFNEYRTVTRTAEKENRPLIEVEREVLGVTHADAGAYLLAVWGLPIVIVQAVAFHHAPAESVTRESLTSAAIHIAESILESQKPLEEIISSYPSELGLLQESDTFSALVPGRPFRAPEGRSPERNAPRAEALN